MRVTLGDTLRLSFQSIILHKFGTLLTALGILFGVASVIAMMAIAEGGRLAAISDIEKRGIDNILVYSVEPPKGQTISGEGDAVIRYGLKEKDYQHFAHSLENVKEVTKMRDLRRKIFSKGKRINIWTWTVSYGFLGRTKSEMIDGRYFSKLDFKLGKRVCIIGKKTRRKMFKFDSPIGKQVKFANAVFTIIGVYENSYDMKIGEKEVNEMILIPYPTSKQMFGNTIEEIESRHKRYTYEVHYTTLIITVKDIASIHHTSRRVASYLKKEHPRSDWKIFTPLSLLEQREKTEFIFKVVMLSIASISLIVGGIGIMNIMLATVYERTKEIGCRMALGARKKDILLQFLTETMALSGVGGVAGIVLGVTIAKSVSAFADMPTVISLWSVVISFCVSVMVGIVFGTYPAVQASKLNPIDALRSE